MYETMLHIYGIAMHVYTYYTSLPIMPCRIPKSSSWLSSSNSLRGSTNRNPIMQSAPSRDVTVTIKQKISCSRFEANDIFFLFGKNELVNI